MQLRHYAPQTPMLVTNDVWNTIERLSTTRVAVLSFRETINHPAIIAREILSIGGDLQEAAHHLYDALHRLDQAKPDVIIAEWMPEEGIGLAINDKLRRGAESVLLS
jgi:L-threonylcarbamoyladenylate synthase